MPCKNALIVFIEVLQLNGDESDSYLTEKETAAGLDIHAAWKKLADKLSASYACTNTWLRDSKKRRLSAAVSF